MQLSPDLAAIRAAHERIQPFIHRTSVLTCSAINALANAHVYFKCENFQKVGAFKFRGATNAVQSLSEETSQRGVVTHSSGNHAAALALAARHRGIPAYIVMPNNAPAVKRVAVQGYGGRITECEPTQAAREAACAELVRSTGATLVHPYDDEAVIAGQGTAALELLEEVPDLAAILAPVGGGGLLSGTLIAAKGIRPSIRVIGCEPKLAGDAAQSMQEGRIVPQLSTVTIADGLRTSLGPKTFPIIKEHVETIALVEEAEIVAALRLILERMKIVIEPSSAVPLAALLNRPLNLVGLNVGIILSGGNLDVSGALPVI
ncbi:MAG TPA: pyridoxal-phosphate dependent enzyme [Gemmataceae bacterium]|jgi:threonine dehydratase|nr:pyridoxal-phosphate dependent enzyme [Gemmataceae bacterium]